MFKLICKRDGQWILVGHTDMGENLLNLDYILHGKKQKKLATHVLQLTFSGYIGFRWPVAYFGSTTANACHLHSIFWQAVDMLGQYGFTVDFCNLDGASTNRAFMKMLIPTHQQELHNFAVTDMYYPEHKIVIMQDIKHVIKKIRNSIFSSRLVNKDSDNVQSVRYILLDAGKPVVWDTFESAAKYNTKFGIRIHNKLTSDAINLSQTGKMRNALAEQVLDSNMLDLVQAYKDSKEELDHDVSGITVLQHTSKLVQIFHDMRPIYTMEDKRIDDVRSCAFFSDWQMHVLQDKEISAKNKYRHLITEQTLTDIKSALFGFIQLCDITTDLKMSIRPALINSDIIENLFCQQRGICHGLNTNPTLLQYGPALNSIILGQCTVSNKCNSGGKAKFFKAVVPVKLVSSQKKKPLRM